MYGSTSNWYYDGGKSLGNILTSLHFAFALSKRANLELTVIERYAYVPGGINDCNYAALNGDITGALTTVNPSTQINHITLCPPALELAQRAHFADLAAIPQGFVERLNAWLALNPRTAVGIDNFYFYESTVLHEVSFCLTNPYLLC